MQFFKHSRKNASKKVTGQGMSEYLIIVGLIAVAGIATMGFMGTSVRSQVAGMATELAGGNASGAISQADAAASAAILDAQNRRSLSSYAGANQ